MLFERDELRLINDELSLGHDRSFKEGNVFHGFAGEVSDLLATKPPAEVGLDVTG